MNKSCFTANFIHFFLSPFLQGWNYNLPMAYLLVTGLSFIVIVCTLGLYMGARMHAQTLTEDARVLFPSVTTENENSCCPHALT